MTQHIHEGTPQQLAAWLGKLPNEKRYRVLVEEEPIDEAAPLPDPENAASIALLKSWLAEDATDDPEEIRQAEEELREFKRNMNANRAATGERIPYPDVAE